MAEPSITMKLMRAAHVGRETHETHAVHVDGRDTGIVTIAVRGPDTYRAEIRRDGEITPIHSEEELAWAVANAAQAWSEQQGSKDDEGRADN